MGNKNKSEVKRAPGQAKVPAQGKISNSQKKPGKGFIYLSLAVIFILTCIAFGPSLKFELTNWDDGKYVAENSDIREFSGKTVKKAFTTYYVGNYQPLVILSYALVYSIGKLDPAGYHFLNLLFHLANSLLVFWFIYKISGRLQIALIAGLLFGIHPLHVESVAWVSGYKDLLYTFFFLLSLLSYMKYVENGRKISLLLLSLFLFVLSCLSKGMAIMLPFVLILIDYYKGRQVKASLKEKIPFLVVMLVFGIVAFKSQQAEDALRESGTGFPQNLFIASYGLVFYVYKMFWPFNLSAVYPYPGENSGGYLPGIFMVAPFVAAALLGFVWFLYKKSGKWVLFGFLFYLVNVLMVLQIIPLGNAVVSDRYFYLSSVGLFFMAGYGFEKLMGYFKSSQTSVWVSTGLVVFILMGITRERSAVWKNSIALWDSVIESYPDYAKPVFPYVSRGISKDMIGDFKGAVKDYNKTLELKPDYAHAYNNRGNTLQKLGDLQGALKDFNMAIELDPRNPQYYTNRGSGKFALKDYTGAVNDYLKAIELNPSLPESYYSLGTVQLTLEQYQQAYLNNTRAIELRPDFAEAYSNRGNARYFLGDMGGACQDWQQGASLGNKSAKDNFNSLCKGK